MMQKLVWYCLLLCMVHINGQMFRIDRRNTDEGRRKSQSSENLPNIIVVVCDSMDGRLLPGGRYDGIVELPNILELSKRGFTYLNAYTNNPICVPSRSALWSGMHTHITESWNNYKGLPDNFNTTWADRLTNEAGYRSKILGKVDIKSGSHSLSNRVEAWTRNVNFTLRQEGRPMVKLTGTNTTEKVNLRDWKVVDKAVHFLHAQGKTERRDFGSPFLLYVGLNNPHPYSTPEEGEHPGGSTFKTSPYWLDKVTQDKVPIPPWIEWGQIHPVDRYSTIVKNCSSNFTHDELVDIKTYFYAMCAETDAMLGKIVKAAERNGLLESTYVIFTSDHGELAMEHRQFYKMSMYEGSSHVPLIISPPEGSGRKLKRSHNLRSILKKHLYHRNTLGGTYTTPVSLIDLYPTLIDVAGLTKTNNLNGSSLLPVQMNQHPGWVLSQYHGCNVNASTYMLRTGPWKYITFDNGPSDMPTLLFHVDSDPDELQNLAQIFPSVASNLDRFLQDQIDYPAVTKRVQLYNKEIFYEWMKSEGSRYDNEMANLRWWMDWQKNPVQNQRAIEEWLNQTIFF